MHHFPRLLTRGLPGRVAYFERLVEEATGFKPLRPDVELVTYNHRHTTNIVERQCVANDWPLVVLGRGRDWENVRKIGLVADRLEKSTADYVLAVDGDDVVLSDTIDRCVDELEHSGAAVLFSGEPSMYPQVDDIEQQIRAADSGEAPFVNSGLAIMRREAALPLFQQAKLEKPVRLRQSDQDRWNRLLVEFRGEIAVDSGSSVFHTVPGDYSHGSPKRWREFADERCSVVIASWKRPDDVRTICSALSGFERVGEIIVWHNSPDGDGNPFDGLQSVPKVRVVTLSDDFGIASRWRAFLLARFPVIISQDDDYLFPEETIEELFSMKRQHPGRIVGVEGRKFEEARGFVEYNTRPHFGDCHVLLGHAVALNVSHALAAIQAEQDYAATYGERITHNGDDIFLSFASMQASGQQCLARELPRRKLSNEHAVSSNPRHVQERSEIVERMRRFFRLPKTWKGNAPLQEPGETSNPTKPTEPKREPESGKPKTPADQLPCIHRNPAPIRTGRSGDVYFCRAFKAECRIDDSEFSSLACSRCERRESSGSVVVPDFVSEAVKRSATEPTESAIASSVRSAAGDVGPVPPSLAVGMAVGDRVEMLEATLETLRTNTKGGRSVEVVVVDNTDPQHAEWVASCVSAYDGTCVRFDAFHGNYAPKDLVFRAATADVVVCMDAHVFLGPKALPAIRNYYRDNPGSRDMLVGPMVGRAGDGITTHMSPKFGEDRNFGVWMGGDDADPRGYEEDGEPFEVPMHGCGFFAMWASAWPGFCAGLRGFGTEEGYIHAKVRRGGGRVLCHPGARWWHSFRDSAAGNESSRNMAWTMRLRNQLIAWNDARLPVEMIRKQFAADIAADPELTRLFERLRKTEKTRPPIDDPISNACGCKRSG